jgi:hypothetical protein
LIEINSNYHNSPLLASQGAELVLKIGNLGTSVSRRRDEHEQTKTQGGGSKWGQKKLERTPDITVVVTSCGRYDLLSQTLESFLERNTDGGIARILVVETVKAIRP